MFIMSPDRSSRLRKTKPQDDTPVASDEILMRKSTAQDVFYSLPSLKNSFLPKEIYNAKENREGIESTVNRSDEAS
jgi:hypothetical protein